MSDFPYEEAAMSYNPDEDSTSSSSSETERVRGAHERELMSIDGVEGVGIGRTAIGADAILVYVRDEGAKQRVPRAIGGLPVEIIVTGIIDAQAG